jgi:cysteine synthase A
MQKKPIRLSDRIGNTPLIKITDKIYAKAELFNPTGSIKDRPASLIINTAEKEGRLKRGDTICEATSGNMGVSFAWLAAERGYKCIIVMPSNMSMERKKTLTYYGAELIEVPPGEFDAAIALRDKLCKDNGWFNCNQFHNQLNIVAHRETTAKEILKDINHGAPGYKCVSAFISGTGTGGTLMGAGLAIKKQIPLTRIIAVEPLESPVMSGGKAGLHGIQGIGDGSKFLVDMNHVNEVITISTEDAKARALQLAREMGIFVGISAGSNILAAERWVEDNNPDGIVITFLCDRGDRYFSCL